MQSGDDPSSHSIVFVSYSSVDRPRVAGLALLLQALGHEVFFDQRSILPGRRWRAELRRGLDEADVLVLFWTKHAARSDWVRKETEHFLVTHPNNPLVPVLGDETPLTELLSEQQATDFTPLVNELLAMQRDLTAKGVGPAAVRTAVVERLADAGIELDESRRERMFALFGRAGRSSAIAGVFFALGSMLRALVAGAVQLSPAQLVLVGAAATAGTLVCPPWAEQAAATTGVPTPAVLTTEAGGAEQRSAGAETLKLRINVLIRQLGSSRSRPVSEVDARRERLVALYGRAHALGDSKGPDDEWVAEYQAIDREVSELE